MIAAYASRHINLDVFPLNKTGANGKPMFGKKKISEDTSQRLPGRSSLGTIDWISSLERSSFRKKS